MPDCPSQRVQDLACSGKIKPRSKVPLTPTCAEHITSEHSFQVIFGTGDNLRATTLTANEGFVRAAAGKVHCYPAKSFPLWVWPLCDPQGVHINAVVHGCCALAEASVKDNPVLADSATDKGRLHALDKAIGQCSALVGSKPSGQDLCAAPPSDPSL